MFGDGIAAASIQGLDNMIQGFWNRSQANQAWKRQKKVLQRHIQWRVADMRAAGLNPVLAARSAFGGGAPSVAPGTTTGGGVGAAYAAGSQAGTARRRQVAEAEVMQSQADLNAERGQSEQRLRNLMSAQIEAQSANAQQAAAQARLLRADAAQRELMNELYSTDYGRALLYLRETMGSLGSAAIGGALGGVMGSRKKGTSTRPGPGNRQQDRWHLRDPRRTPWPGQWRPSDNPSLRR